MPALMPIGAFNGASPAVPARTGLVLFDVSVLELEALVSVLPLLGYPVLIIVGLNVETPVLQREPATRRRRTAATVLAVISLVTAAPLLVMAWTPGALRVLLLDGLLVPAVLTLVRLRLPPRTATVL